MSIVNDDEEKTRNEQTSMGGVGSWVGGGATSGSAPTQQVPQQNPSGFVNIQQYLGGPGSAESGAKIAGNVAARADHLGQSATGLTDTFSHNAQNNIAAGTPTYNESIANGWMNQTGINPNAEQTANSGGTAPSVSFSSTAPQSDYTGMTKYSDMPGYGDALGAANKSAEWMKNSGDQNGLMAQLQGMQQQPGYTHGEGALDTALAASGGQNILGGSQKKWGGVQDYLKGAQDKVQGQIGSAQTQAANVSNQWKSAQDAATANAAATNQRYGDLKDAYTAAENKKTAEAAAAAAKPVTTVQQPKTLTAKYTTPPPVQPGTLQIDPTLDGSNLDYSKYGNKEEKDKNKFPMIGQLMI